MLEYILFDAEQLIYEQDPTRKSELEDCLLSYGEDYRILGEPLLLEQPPSRNSMQKSEIDKSRKSKGESQLFSQIFTDTPSMR